MPSNLADPQGVGKCREVKVKEEDGGDEGLGRRDRRNGRGVGENRRGGEEKDEVRRGEDEVLVTDCRSRSGQSISPRA